MTDPTPGDRVRVVGDSYFQTFTGTVRDVACREDSIFPGPTVLVELDNYLAIQGDPIPFWKHELEETK